MHKITAIARQVRASDHFNVFVDGRFAFSMRDVDLVSLGLEEGKQLEDEEINELHERADASKSYSMALRFIEVRPRSVAEVREYLGRKGARDPDSVVERLRQGGLLNDAEFAATWIANRRTLRPRSARMLTYELSKKGVASSDIAAALAAGEDDNDFEAALAIGAKKRRVAAYRDAKKLEVYLARQGFSYETIKKALKRLNEVDDS